MIAGTTCTWLKICLQKSIGYMIYVSRVRLGAKQLAERHSMGQ